MTGPELLMLGTAWLCVLATRWNATAGALAASFFIVRLAYLWTGEAPGTVACLFIDFTVIAIINMKPPEHWCQYRNLAHQFACLWLERSLWDRVVIACFPVMWATYAFVADPWLAWWLLWWSAMCQFAASLLEAINKNRNRRAANAKAAETLDTPSSGAEFAWAGGVRGYG